MESEQNTLSNASSLHMEQPSCTPGAAVATAAAATVDARELVRRMSRHEIPPPRPGSPVRNVVEISESLAWFDTLGRRKVSGEAVYSLEIDPEEPCKCY